MPIQRIIQGLNQFHDNYFVSHQELFEQLSHGQSPEVLFNLIPPYGALNSGEGAGIEYKDCCN
jgi:carbonic anhydrase